MASEFLAGTHLADIAPNALAAEALVLLAYRGFTGRGLPVTDVVSLLLPGAGAPGAWCGPAAQVAAERSPLSLIVAARIEHAHEPWDRRCCVQ